MKFALISLLVTLLATSILAAAPQIPVIVSYPDNTPDSVLDEAMHAIKSAGGFITHKYKLIKGFAAKASEASLEKVSTLGEKYNALIETDEVVHAAGSNKK